MNWPVEQTTYTAAAVILAVDALSEGSPGADIMRGTTLAAGLRRDRPGVRLPAPTAQPASGSPASPAVRRSTRIEPTTSTSVNAPLASAGR